MTPSEDRLLDVREAATMLGMKPCTLYQWAYERRIPVVKLFGRALPLQAQHDRETHQGLGAAGVAVTE